MDCKTILKYTAAEIICQKIFLSPHKKNEISKDPTAMRITGIVGPAVGFFFFLTSVPEVIGVIGLLKRRGWARILVMIIAVLGLILTEDY